MMKHYFNYGANISSIEATQVIASPLGVGVFVGFGKGVINTLGNDNSIDIYPNNIPEGTAIGSDSYDIYENRDRIARRYISNLGSDIDSPNIRFGLIARDGSIHISDDEIINIPILGTKGILDEVLVFAIHTHISEAVDNPITFIALFNESNTSFYELYKRSRDISYNNTLEDGIEVLDPTKNDTYNYHYLDSKLQEVCTDYKNNKDSWIPIGIYGTGTNKKTLQLEYFNLVPYCSCYPGNLTYNTAIHSLFIQSISHIESLTKSIISNLGIVEMWAGQTVPDKFHLCDGTALLQSEYPDLYKILGDQYNKGKNPLTGETYNTEQGYFRLPDLRTMFIAGYADQSGEYDTVGNTGGSKGITLTVDQIPSHTHSMSNSGNHSHNNSINASNHDDGNVGSFIETSNDAHDGHGPAPVNPTWGLVSIYDSGDHTHTINNTGGNQPHENRPPYYVLKYIMRIKL